MCLILVCKYNWASGWHSHLFFNVDTDSVMIKKIKKTNGEGLHCILQKFEGEV